MTQRAIQSRITGLEKVPVANIVRFRGGNPREMDEKSRATLSKSMEEFGAVLPIVVRKLGKRSYEILNGHHRLDEVVRTGGAEIDVLVVDCADDQKAKAITLALNNISADWDLDQLNTYVEAALKKGSEAAWFAGVTGFAAKEVDALTMAGTEFLAEVDEGLADAKALAESSEGGEEEAEDTFDTSDKDMTDGMEAVSLSVSPAINELIYEAIDAAKKQLGVTETNAAVEHILRTFIGEVQA